MSNNHQATCTSLGAVPGRDSVVLLLLFSCTGDSCGPGPSTDRSVCNGMPYLNIAYVCDCAQPLRSCCQADETVACHLSHVKAAHFRALSSAIVLPAEARPKQESKGAKTEAWTLRAPAQESGVQSQQHTQSEDGNNALQQQFGDNARTHIDAVQTTLYFQIRLTGFL